MRSTGNGFVCVYVLLCRRGRASPRGRRLATLSPVGVQCISLPDLSERGKAETGLVKTETSKRYVIGYRRIGRIGAGSV